MSKSNKRVKKVKKNQKEAKKNQNNGKKVKFKQKHPKLMVLIRIIILLIVLVTVIGAGIFAGLIFGVFGDDFSISKDELIISESNSIIVDTDGNVIADLSGDEKRKIITLSNMSEYLPKAYIAIEDERFYKHNGVDIKRTLGAIVTYVLHKGDSSFGGSTITQQLVKNITKEDKKEITRKVKEWAKAVQVERMLSKDQILELYLNILFVGGKNYGVQMGSEYYFNKSASELSLAQCAFLAGINNSPNLYNPYGDKDNTELINKRTKTVLNKMKELSYINEDEYNQAIQEVDGGLAFAKAQSSGNVYSYHTDATISQVIEDVAEAKGISRQLAENYVYSSGLTIYSTQNTSIQKKMEEEFAKTSKYTLTSKTIKDENGNYQKSQAAMVVIDNATGYVVGVVGGLGEKTESRGLNRATQSLRQTGSSMKPLADLVPGIEEKIITAATVYNDAETEFENGKYTPKNQGKFRGYISIRSAIETSQNIPFVKVMVELTPKKSLQYLKKMGISTLDDKNDNTLSLAIGGVYNGISPLEMAAGYETIANNGVYTSPTFYTKVTDSSGNVVLEAKKETTKVMSEDTAYVVKNILTQTVVGGQGTAKYCAISGMDVAAKTGTTNGDKDRWLCGFTNYYTAATWYGFDQPEEVKFSGNNPAGQLWDNVMTSIHSGLAESRFKATNNIVTATICADTGMAATEKCVNKYQEIFISGTVPSACSGHTVYQVCNESGKLANEYCPDVATKNTGRLVPKEQLGLWKTVGSVIVEEAPTEICDIHTKPEEQPIDIEVVEPQPEEPSVTTPETTPKPSNNTVNVTGSETNTTNTENNIGNTTNTSGGNTQSGGSNQTNSTNTANPTDNTTNTTNTTNDNTTNTT